MAYMRIAEHPAKEKPEVRSALRAFVYTIKSLWKRGKKVFLQKGSPPSPHATCPNAGTRPIRSLCPGGVPTRVDAVRAEGAGP